MKKKELLRTVKYALVAASAGIIESGTFTLLNIVWHLNPWLSHLIALVLSVLWNFTINRRYTFKSASNIPKAMLLVLAYYAVFTPLSTLFVDYFTSQELVREYVKHAPKWNKYVVKAISMIINFVTEFLFQRFVVFKNTIDTNELAAKEAANTPAKPHDEQ